MGKTAIGWARLGLADGFSCNPIRARNVETGAQGYYCQKIRPGCAQCYASGSQINPLWLKRGNATGLEYTKANQDKIEWYWNERAGLEPFHRKTPSGFFPVDMSDWLGWDAGLPTDFSFRVLAMCAIAPWHRYLLLTKRYDYLESLICRLDYNGEAGVQVGYLGLTPRQLREVNPFGVDLFTRHNIWLGISVSTQDDLKEAEPHLANICTYFGERNLPYVMAISYEPALELVDFSSVAEYIDWIIVGGESDQLVRGKRIDGRPFNVDWAAQTYEWCQAQGVQLYYKQTGNTVAMLGRQAHYTHKNTVLPLIDGKRVEEFPEL